MLSYALQQIKRGPVSTGAITRGRASADMPWNSGDVGTSDGGTDDPGPKAARQVCSGSGVMLGPRPTGREEGLLLLSERAQDTQS